MPSGCGPRRGKKSLTLQTLPPGIEEAFDGRAPGKAGGFSLQATLAGIFGTDEGSAIGVVDGARELGTECVTIIDHDSGTPQEAVREGLMAGAITQNPVGIGYETVRTAVAASKGESVEKNIDTGFHWYDASNMDEPEIAAVLYD